MHDEREGEAIVDPIAAGGDPGEEISPMVAEMVAGMRDFCEAMEAGEPIEGRFNVRTLRLRVRTVPRAPAEVRRVRKSLGASQAVFASFLGVGRNTLRNWEQAARPVPLMASRFLDEIEADPGIWRRRLIEAKAGEGGP